MEPDHRSQAIRATPTDAESKLWSQLRGRRLDGYKFRRQYPIGPFIVDFACIEAALVVEVDGGQHQQRQQADLTRSYYLETHGFRVARFWNHHVLQDTDAVLENILQYLFPAPRPRPPVRRLSR